MSRIGDRKLFIPEGVTVSVNDRIVNVKGNKGELNLNLDKNINVEVKDNSVLVTRVNDSISAKKMHGTTNANINNMLIGVSKGFSKSLEIIGVGYRFNKSGNKLVVHAGKSHTDELDVPEGLTLEVEGNNKATVSGISKEKVGEFAATIRKVRQPEPYKGKGIRYVGEYIRRKEGKKAK